LLLPRLAVGLQNVAGTGFYVCLNLHRMYLLFICSGNERLAIGVYHSAITSFDVCFNFQVYHLLSVGNRRLYRRKRLSLN
jgi:hypothetical protein